MLLYYIKIILCVHTSLLTLSRVPTEVITFQYLHLFNYIQVSVTVTGCVLTVARIQWFFPILNMPNASKVFLTLKIRSYFPRIEALCVYKVCCLCRTLICIITSIITSVRLSVSSVHACSVAFSGAFIRNVTSWLGARCLVCSDRLRCITKLCHFFLLFTS